MYHGLQREDEGQALQPGPAHQGRCALVWIVRVHPHAVTVAMAKEAANLSRDWDLPATDEN